MINGLTSEDKKLALKGAKMANSISSVTKVPAKSVKRITGFTPRVDVPVPGHPGKMMRTGGRPMYETVTYPAHTTYNLSKKPMSDEVARKLVGKSKTMARDRGLDFTPDQTQKVYETLRKKGWNGMITD